MLGLPELPELSQLWVWTGAAMTVVGPAMAVWGAVATHRARKSEARWKGPEITLLPVRTEDGWTQMILLVKNRQDVAMTLDEIRVLRPRRASIIGMAEWDGRHETPPDGAGKSMRIQHPVKAGPTEGQRPSARVTIFIKAPGWEPMARPAIVRVSLRENSMERRTTRHKVVSHLLSPPAEPKPAPIMRRPRQPWLSYDRPGDYWR